MDIVDLLKIFMWIVLYGMPIIVFLGIIIFIVRLIKSKPNYDDMHLSSMDKKKFSAVLWMA